MVNPKHPQLSCLVLSKQQEHHKLVSTWLGESHCVGGVTAVADDKHLKKHLNEAQVHLCIVVLEKHERALPACLQHYVDTPVLVLTDGNKPAKLKTLFQQGASEVVSLRKSTLAKHAINRLLKQCRSTQKLRLLQTHIQYLEKEVAYLQSILKINKRSIVPDAANDEAHGEADRVVAQLKMCRQPVIENVISNYKRVTRSDFSA